MKKIETLWHHILLGALAERRYQHTQKELALRFGFSLSTVHFAIRVPTQIGAIRKTSKFFVLQHYEKLLYYWASMRNLERDIFYRTLVNAPLSEIEGLIPPGAIFACYSAARRILVEPPSDYSRVYFYAKREDLEKIKRRFPPSSQKGSFNLCVLRLPDHMGDYGQITTLPQTFVDIWNLADWYANDFTKGLKEKIDGLLS